MSLIKATKKILHILVAVLFYINNHAYASLVVDVFSHHKNQEVNIALHSFAANPQDFEMTEEIMQVIANDLNGTGIANVAIKIDDASKDAVTQKDISFLNKDRAHKAKYSVTGYIVKDELHKNQYKISFTAWSTASETPVLNRMLVFQGDSVRKVAHAISDALSLHMLGLSWHFNSKIMYVGTDPLVPKDKALKSIGIMDQDGFNKRYIKTKSLIVRPFYSSHLKKIIYVSYLNGEPRIKLMDIATGNTEDLGNILKEFKDVTVISPKISPDGQFIVLSAMSSGMSADLYRVELKTKKIIRLTNGGLNVAPSFSPDGKEIAYSSDKSGKQSVYIMTIDGTPVRRLSMEKGAYQEPAWSPDGKWIACTKIYRGNFYLVVLTPFGEKERILASGYLTESPAWSPNGQEIIFAYQKKTKDKTQLKIVSISGQDLRTIQTPDIATEPFWFSLQ